MRLNPLPALAAIVFLSAATASGQTPAPADSPDPGVKPVRLMDRAEIRVSRVEIQPGAVRSVHAHDDVKYHVWVALAGKLEITIGSDKPVAAAEGQAFFMRKGTRHGFRNVGNTPGVAMEIFVKGDAAAGDLDVIGAALAALGK